MRQSKLFTKTRREAPKDEVSKNAILLTRAGFINKERAGVYDYLPLGLRVIKKLEDIVREEMNALGGQEFLMSSLQRQELWEKHFNQDRWNDKNVDIWFKTRLKDGSELGLAFTHEEPISNMLEQFVSSYNDLPFSVYQFQTKFRNELRAQSGILRGREFLMKDLYSFSRTPEEHDDFYERAKSAYRNIFNKVGIGDSTYLTKASGGSFSEFSHEFQTLSLAGEDTIYITDENKKEAENKEIGVKDLEEKKAIEVGNIFTLGTKFSDPHLKFKDKDGKERNVFMGSYGIGLGRLMGTIVEVLSDDKGIVWPHEVSPFDVHLLSLTDGSKVFADEVYKTLTSQSFEVLYDDRDLRAGEKFADADLIGIPKRIVVGDKTLESKMLEIKDRATGETSEMALEDFIKSISL
ncbi:MAG: prolyl-tRNA synthetase [Candidatus Zambryskibacteria bacterium CG11_big_fil_rev_8_21_14_0_20_42_18]|uniref:Proline--tRNA ligase n=1 Tax=Candidatus Zambryskibacteria bacterium CG_4_9_14_3_um_filter_42_15 TaxID=1975112 RepID=A0A2M7WSG9_9BACT|nr:MAG: prolyl-tRNA synthetase [Candidatus Zambryskibacteria bacterium CG11_big_fil_rev_8_21_14_0_20_42_18]PJA32893.1 MAG: prolyl-tRNA synthetase [Candidatus Zambryskibacteria bacterium CG_4_9_14_3_um_filter_42_15]